MMICVWSVYLEWAKSPTSDFKDPFSYLISAPPTHPCRRARLPGPTPGRPHARQTHPHAPHTSYTPTARVLIAPDHQSQHTCTPHAHPRTTPPLQARARLPGPTPSRPRAWQTTPHASHTSYTRPARCTSAPDHQSQHTCTPHAHPRTTPSVWHTPLQVRARLPGPTPGRPRAWQIHQLVAYDA